MLLIPSVLHQIDSETLHHLTEVFVVALAVVTHVEGVARVCADSSTTNYECCKEAEGEAMRSETFFDRQNRLAPAIMFVGVRLALGPVVEYPGTFARGWDAMVIHDLIPVALIPASLCGAMAGDERVDRTPTTVRHCEHGPSLRTDRR